MGPAEVQPPTGSHRPDTAATAAGMTRVVATAWPDRFPAEFEAEQAFEWLLSCWRHKDDVQRAGAPAPVLLAAWRDLDDARLRMRRCLERAAPAG